MERKCVLKQRIVFRFLELVSRLFFNTLSQLVHYGQFTCIMLASEYTVTLWNPNLWSSEPLVEQNLTDGRF